MEDYLESNTEEQKDELVEGEMNLYRISSNKYTPPGIKDQLRNLYETLSEFYIIGHRIRNPD
jgi:hypothetical protein